MANHEEMPVVEGYTPEKRTIGIMKANVLALLLMVVVGAIGFVALWLLWGSEAFHFSPKSYLKSSFLFFILLIAGMAVHELIHGITWMVLTRTGFRHVSFGAMKGALYCHIDVPMRKGSYVTGALMPLLLLGLVPLVAALSVGSLFWLLYGILFTGAAMGDIMIVWAIRNEPSDALVYDHPSEGGCYVYHKNANV